jgi:RNA polymerase sigma-70 factor (ECF subfamily)
MDHESLVRKASGGDVRAFVELTGRFQHFAFGSAITLVHDFQQAEDVVQEAFLAAWSALPTLADPAAFPGWLRAIVRHQAFRVLRRRNLDQAPLSEADDVVSEEPLPDHRLEHRQQAAVALAAIAGLPDELREPATLFFVHECSHQDIAAFLNVPVTTVNNRLHAARSQLKQRMLTMVAETLHTHGLPDDFAHRIGRLVQARGNVVEALFDPNAMPDLLSEIAVSDEAQRRAVTVQVVQRPGGGIVRGVAVTPVDSVPRGATVLSSSGQTKTPVNLAEIGRIMALLAGQPRQAAGEGELLETGIKVIDVMCPLVAGGTVAIAGEYRTGTVVVTEEIVRRLSGAAQPISLFVLAPPPSPDFPPGMTFAEGLKREGYSEGNVGAVQTFYLRCSTEPWTKDQLAALAPLDAVIHLSRERSIAKIYPTVDVLGSRSRLLEARRVGDDHAEIAERVRQVLARLWATDRGHDTDKLTLERACKLQYFFTQPSSWPNPTPSVRERPSAWRRRFARAAEYWTVAMMICRPMRSTSAATWRKSGPISGGRSRSVRSRFDCPGTVEAGSGELNAKRSTLLVVPAPTRIAAPLSGGGSARHGLGPVKLSQHAL